LPEVGHKQQTPEICVYEIYLRPTLLEETAVDFAIAHTLLHCRVQLSMNLILTSMSKYVY